MTRPKLLLADDSVTIRKVVELTFADEGIDVSTTADSQSAMQSFVEIQPDIVLVDAGLAGTNGYQICEMIKADEATRHIPVMLLAGSFEPFDPEEANRVGADAFMTKPFNSIRELVNRVNTLLRRDPAADAAIPSEQPLGAEEPAAESPPSETDDIEDLYRSSFSDTAGIEEFDTVEQFDTADDLSDDAGMDDEMIEASYRAPASETGFEVAENVKEFDWSPEAIVSPDSSTPDSKELDPAEWAENNSSLGEDRISTEPDLSSFETVEFNSEPAEVPPPSPSEEANSDDGSEELLALFEESNQPNNAIHETVPYSDGEQPVALSDKGSGEEISQEMIETIVRLVVDRLSDSVVRDIARVEVPRIAEKLIREALEEEKKG